MPAVGLPQLDSNRLNGTIYTPKASPDVQFLSGGVFHYVDGIVFTVVFVVSVYPLLRWRSTALGNALKGLFFGTILATISCVFMIPRVYFPDAHVGFFSHHLGSKLILAATVLRPERTVVGAEEANKPVTTSDNCPERANITRCLTRRRGHRAGTTRRCAHGIAPVRVQGPG